MRRQLRCVFITAAASLLLSGVSAFADTYTFSLLPAGGDITGAPGSVVGWGYEIANKSSTHWLDPLAVNAGIFQFATLDSGDYFNFPLVAPNTTVTVSFARAGGSGFGAGLAALTWNASAPLGFANNGDFDLSACWANSTGSCINAAPDSMAPYSATVSQVPEPSSMALLGLAVLMFSVVLFIRKADGLPCQAIGPAKSND